MPVTVSDRPWRRGSSVTSAGLSVRSARGASRSPRGARADFVEVPDYIRLVETIRGVVEIVPGSDGRPPEDLLWVAYQASWCGSIVLALNGVTVVATNQVMDSIVPHFPLSIPGVLYVDAQNRPLLRQLLDDTDMIFGQTDEFRRMALGSPAVVITRLSVMSSYFGLSDEALAIFPGNFNDVAMAALPRPRNCNFQATRNSISGGRDRSHLMPASPVRAEWPGGRKVP